MTQMKTTFAALGIAALLLPAAASADAGKKLSRADFDRCNQQAMQIAGIDSDSPAASPQLGTGSGASQPSGSQYGTQSGSQPSSGSQTGTQSGTGMQTGSGTQSGTGTQMGSGTQTGSSMSGTSGAAGAGDDAKLDRAVQAYRDCLQQQQQRN
jgi:hypothetical protein